jgi:hypothetical protein
MSEIVESNRPLTDDEQDSLLAELDDSSILDRIAVLGILFTGLEAQELAHVTREWIEFQEEMVVITVQPERCEIGDYLGKGIHSRVSPRSYGNSTCYLCKEMGGVFTPEHPRVVPVKEEVALTAFKTWFGFYDKLGGQLTLIKRVGEVGERCGIPRLSPQVLKHTFGVDLAQRGFSREDIRLILPINESIEQGDGSAVRQYGEYVEGENPFRCLATRDNGEACQQWVAYGDHCSVHSEDADICGSVASSTGEQCSRPATESDGYCAWHSDDRELWSDAVICGAEKARGGICQQVVDHPGTNCRWHTGPTCGAELSGKRKGTCSEPVESEDERCFKHSDG